MVKSIIYKITYIPHLNTNNPKFYIGSKYNYNPKRYYMGSVSSNMVFEFTGGISLKEWWKKQTKNSPNDFVFEILSTYNDISPQELVNMEKELHINLNVLSDDYFNQSIATTGFCSVIKQDYVKKIMSEKTKKYWSTPEGIEKRKRLSERNRLTKSKEQQNFFNDPILGKERRKERGLANPHTLTIEYKGKVYRGKKEFEEQTGVSLYLYRKYYHLGIDPETIK